MRRNWRKTHYLNWNNCTSVGMCTQHRNELMYSKSYQTDNISVRLFFFVFLCVSVSVSVYVDNDFLWYLICVGPLFRLFFLHCLACISRMWYLLWDFLYVSCVCCLNIDNYERRDWWLLISSCLHQPADNYSVTNIWNERKSKAYSLLISSYNSDPAELNYYLVCAYYFEYDVYRSKIH